MPTGHLPPYRQTLLAALALTACVLCLCFVLPGCTAAGKLDPGAVQAQIDTQRATIAQEVARQNAALAAAQNANDQNAAARAQKTLDALKGIDDKLSVTAAALGKSLNADGTVNFGGAGAVAATALPPPFNAIALVGLPLLAAGIQEWRKRQAVSTANGATDSLAKLLAGLIPDGTGHPAVSALPPDAKAALASAIGDTSVAKNGA